MLISSTKSVVFKCGHITCFPCLKECRKYTFKFDIIVPFPICKQSSRLNEIYTYKVEKNKRLNYDLMRIFKHTKFICSYEGCGMSYSLEIIQHYEMFECLYRSILCFAQCCKFINNVDTIIQHYINCPFHLLYCALFNLLCNVSVLTHDCNVIKSQRSIYSFFKYYYENPPANHFHKNVFLRNYSYTETFKNRWKINYDMFMSVALSNPPPASVFTKRTLRRQHVVVDLSSYNTYNNTDKSYYFTTFYVKFLHLVLRIDVSYFVSILYIYSCFSF